MSDNPNSAPNTLPIDSPDRRRLPPLLRRAWFSLNQAFRRRILHLEITPDQFTALRILGEADQKGQTGLSQRELTEAMSSDPNTVASLVERMEGNGLIQRRPHETDRRANRIRIQPKGKKTYAAAREIAVALQHEVLGAIELEKRDAFLADLAEVADACRRAADDSVRKD